MIVDIYLVVSGYLGWYQTRNVLVSPLIPCSTIEQITRDSRLFEASLAAAIFLLAGILCFSFQFKRAAFILLIIGIIAHQLIFRYKII
jgi:hypothetical protein